MELYQIIIIVVSVAVILLVSKRFRNDTLISSIISTDKYKFSIICWTWKGIRCIVYTFYNNSILPFIQIIQ